MSTIVEAVKHPSKSNEGRRTYIMATVIIIHQVLKMLGIDVPDSDIHQALSTLLDIGLGIGAIYYRWQASRRMEVKSNV